MVITSVLRGIAARWAIVLIVAGGVTLLNAAEPKMDWDPEHTHVLVVGLLQWKYADIWSPFPAAMKDRRDEQLFQYFKDAGVPEDQITYLQDSDATKADIQKAFDELLDETDTGDLLIVYFAGHGYRNRDSDKTWFACYDAGKKDASGWGVPSIFAAIEKKFSGNRVLLLADCCHSGALYDEVLKHKDSHIAYAAITSSYTHNTSTGNWTFSDSLLAGLRGEPVVDTNRDGVIELNEIAHYAESEMAFIEGQKSMFTASPKFPPTAKIVPVEGKADPRIDERGEALWEGKWYKVKVIDVEDTELKVHYLGFSDQWDEWITPDKLRPYRPHEFKVGAKVQVLFDEDGKWYPAKVLKAWHGLHLIRYDGYDNSWDEWVGPKMIRAPE